MKFYIPKPCHENWKNMTANEKGRYCKVCNKTVADLTSKTPEEVKALYDSEQGKLCGHVRVSQLGNFQSQDGLIAQKLKSVSWRLRRWAMAASVALLLNGLTILEGYSQCTVETGEYKLTPLNNEKEGEIILKGKIRDKETGEFLIGAVVVIENYNTGALTDYEGEFTIRTTLDSIANGNMTISIRYLGYHTISIRDVEPKSYSLSVTMSEEALLIEGGVMFDPHPTQGYYERTNPTSSPYNVTIIKPKP